MIKVLESTVKFNRPNGGVNIVLTHADADGLVSAFQIKKYIEWCHHYDDNVPEDYIIISSLKAQPEETDKMLRTACKYMKINISDLDDNDHIFVLDRPTFTKDMLNTLSKDVYYTACDHHESSIPYHKEVAEYFESWVCYLEDGLDNCGASLSNEFIRDEIESLKKMFPEINLEDDIEALYYIAQITNDWDTFRWKHLQDTVDQALDNVDSKQSHAVTYQFKYLPAQQRIKNAQAIQACDKILGEVMTWNSLNESWNKHDEVWRNEEYEKSDWFWLEFYERYAKIASEIFNNRLNDQKIICDYIVTDKIRTCTLHGRAYRICFMFGMEEFQSMLSQYIFEEHPIVDAVIWMNNSGTISIRTSDKTDIKSNDLAIAIGTANGFSGGGHPKAAGGRVKNYTEIQADLLNRVVKGLIEFGFEYIPSDINSISIG